MAIAAIAGLATVGGAMAAAGTLAIGWAAGLTAFAIGAGLSIVSRALMPKPDFGSMLGGVTGTVREAASARKVIYGKCRVGGSVVFIANSNQNEYLYLVIAYAAHEIQSYEEFYFNDELVWTATGGFQSDWGSWALINKYTGTQTSSDPTLTAASSFWTSTHKLSGVSYAMVRLKWDKDRKKFPNGVPNISAVIKGKKVYDPRTSTTAYSNNPALCVRDYLTNTYYGLGEASANLDDATFITAANICEESVSLDGGGSHDRWTCDGVIDTSSTIKNNIEALLASMGGRLGYSGGKYFVQAAAYVTPTITIDESVMVGELQVQTKQSRRGVYNGVKGVFLSEEENYTLCDYPAQISSTYSTEDGDPVYLDMPLPFVTNNVRAQRLAKIALLKSRQQVSVTVPLNLAGLQLKAGDFINISNSRMGWTSKPFEVLDYTLAASTDGSISVNVSCIETASAVYDWTTSDQNPFNSPSDPTTNDGSTVATPTSLILTETTAISGDGAVVDALRIRWTASADGFVDYYEIVITEVSTGYTFTVTTPTTEYLVVPIRTGTNYTVAVFAVNSIGAKSLPLTGSLTPVGDTSAPSAPTSVTANGGFKNVVLNWTSPSDADLAFVDIYMAQESYLAYSRIATVGSKPSTEGVFVHQGLANGEDYWYKLKAIDRSGNASAFTSAVSATTDAREENFSPRDVRGYVYYQVSSASNPGTPSASAYNFNASAGADPFTWSVSNWAINPPEQDGSDGTFWASRFQVLESEYDGSQSISFSTPFQSFVFDGLVTFVNLNAELGDPASTLITTIDGGLIKTGTVELSGDNTAGMAVRLGKTSYSDDANDGFWLGNTGTSSSPLPQFNIGDSDNYLKWDGNDLKTSGLKVYDANGEVILNAGGGGLGIEGGSIIRNGAFRDESKSSAVYLTNTSGTEIIDGWEVADSSFGSSFTSYWGTQGVFQLSSNHAIRTQNVFPVEFDETLYLAVNNFMPSGSTRAWAIQVQFQDSSGNFVDQVSIAYNSTLWGDTAPTAGTRQISQAVIPVPNNSSIKTCRIRIDGNNGSSYVNIWNVYLGRSPSQITGETIQSYIADLSVDTLQIAGAAVTAPDGNSGNLSGNLALNTYQNIGSSVSISWSSGVAAPQALIIVGAFNVLGEDTFGNTAAAASIDIRPYVTYGSGTANTTVGAISHSFASGFGGQVTTIAHLDLSGKGSPATIQLQGRQINFSGSGDRALAKYTIAAFVSKR